MSRSSDSTSAPAWWYWSCADDNHVFPHTPCRICRA